MASSATGRRIVQGSGFGRVRRRVDVICLVIVVELRGVGGGMGGGRCRRDIGQRREHRVDDGEATQGEGQVVGVAIPRFTI